MQFDKSVERFPAKRSEEGHDVCQLNHCYVSPLAKESVLAMKDLIQEQAIYGLNRKRSIAMEAFHVDAAELLRTDSSNISFVPNVAVAMNNLAQSFSLKGAEEVIVYKFDYPSILYPWKKLSDRGVVVKEINGQVDSEGRPISWKIEELKQLMTPQTRIVAVSHVNFVSGFAVDLAEISRITKSANVRCIIDAAQSLGAMPIYPEELGIDALVASGWKWLRGPDASAVMYTSPKIRKDLAHPAMVGPDMMDIKSYLDPNPVAFQDGRMFEFSTMSGILMGGTAAAIRQYHLVDGIENIWNEIERLQTYFMARINPNMARRISFPSDYNSGIMSFEVDCCPVELVKRLEAEKIRCTTRAGILRVAIHYYNDEAELTRAAKTINRLIYELGSN